MKKLKTIISCVAITLAAFSFSACNSNSEHSATTDSLNHEHDTSATMANNPASVDKDAEDFAKEAAMGGMMEVEAGKIAVQKAQSSDVKNFGQRMIDDHSKANEELKNLAASKNIVLPTNIDEKHQKHLDDLNKKTCNDFDKEYVKMMVDDHENDVDDFQKAIEKLKDPELKNFASTTLPVLQEHLTQIRGIHDRMK